MLQLGTLLLQIGVILVAARVTGWGFRKIGQPQVMGEMTAGILLGPSVLGWLSPEVSAVLFPPSSLGFLNALSQIGLILFMFLVGLELDPKILRRRSHTAVLTSHTSIVIPFFFGTLLALYLYPRVSDDSVPFTHFALFLGTAMSITAFPVLARILAERQLLRTPVGSMTIACAAVDDVTAWCILAGIVLVVRATKSAPSLWLTVGGVVLFIVLMLFGTRLLLQRLAPRYHAHKKLTQDMLAVILLLVFGSALVTEWLGIHALFGAFLIGAIMPKDSEFTRALTEKLEDLAVVLLLPLYFAYTGLRTSIGSLSGLAMWGLCAAIIAVAIAGKFGGTTLSARLTGMPWRQAGAIGILMNSRGLMELVVVNIGLDIGVISPALFTMLVIMALVTTFITTPLLTLVAPQGQEALATPLLPEDTQMPAKAPLLIRMIARN